MKKALHQAYQHLFYLPLALLLIVLIVRAVKVPIGDFGNYYYASKFLLNGTWGTWVYDPASFNLQIYALGQRNFFLNYTPVPPLSAVLYLPFVFFTPPTAKLLWNIITLLLFLWSLWRLSKHVNFDNRLLLLIPVVVFIPIRNNIFEGQSYFLLFFLLAEGFIQYTNKNFMLMALCWAISIHLKVSPAFVLFFLVFQKDLKSMGLLVATVLILTIISMPLIGVDIWKNYVFKLLPRLYVGAINNTYALNYQSFQVMLKTFFVPDLLHNNHAPFNNSLLYAQVLACFKILVYGIGILYAFSVNNHAQKFSIWLVISLLVSGYGNSFSLLLLILPVLFFADKWKFTDHRFIILLGLLLLISNVPISLLMGYVGVFKFARFWLLLLFFITLVFYSNIKINLYYLLLLLLPFLLIRSVPHNNQNYLLNKEEAFLIYDFRLTEAAVKINYFDVNGPASKRVPIAIVGNKTQYTYQPTNYGKHAVACKLNDSLFVYLSDENRGVGFNTLRISKIKNE